MGVDMSEEIKQSRVGKNPVPLVGVQVTLSGRDVTVKGPKGVSQRTLPRGVEVEKTADELVIHISGRSRQARAMQGLVRALLNNMVVGCSKGFERKLEITGVGYRADLKGGNTLLFQLGYSHPIMFELPAGVTAEVARDNSIMLRSHDKELLGKAAAKIRSFRPPEPYKGKGIRYADEHIIRKAGKAAAR